MQSSSRTISKSKVFALMLLMVAAAAVLICGCANSNPHGPEYKTLAVDPTRDPEKARHLNAEAVEAMRKGDTCAAEKKLKCALAADLMCGPAHNNLGSVYFAQKNYYLAAWEFQYAAKLMPNDPRPKNNLGLVFEETGQLDKAAESYDEAMTLEQDNPEFIGNLARAYVRKGTDKEKARQLLTELVMKDTRPDWVSWGREQLALMGGPVKMESASQPASNP